MHVYAALQQHGAACSTLHVACLGQQLRIEVVGEGSETGSQAVWRCRLVQPCCTLQRERIELGHLHSNGGVPTSVTKQVHQAGRCAG